MKPFQQFIKESTPTVHANIAGAQGGFGSAGTSALGNAGYDPKLFKDPVDDDLLSQDYQTPGQSGLAKWRFSTIWPVSHLTMAGIDDMVNASNKYVNMMDNRTLERIHNNLRQFYEQNDMKKKYNSFIEEAAKKRCPEGQYWCYTDKKCKKIPNGYHVGRGGYLVGHGHHHNGKGNGSHNGNGGGNGNGGNGHSSGGNGNGGNGGGNGGGGE